MNEPRYFLDTNIFLRVIVKDDVVKASHCERIFTAMEEGKIRCFVSSIVLAEIVWTLLSFYKFSKPEVVRIFSSILSLKYLRIQEGCRYFLALEYYKDYPVKFIDALIASSDLIQKKKATIVSYDRDFDKMKQKRVEPSEIIEKLKY